MPKKVGEKMEYKVEVRTKPKVVVSEVIIAESEKDAKQKLMKMLEAGLVSWEDPATIKIELIRDLGWVKTRSAHMLRIDLEEVEPKLVCFMDSSGYKKTMKDAELSDAFIKFCKELPYVRDFDKWDIKGITDSVVDSMKGDGAFEEDMVKDYVRDEVFNVVKSRSSSKEAAIVAADVEERILDIINL